MSPRLGVFSLECMSGLKEAGKANWIRFHVHIPVEGIHSSENYFVFVPITRAFLKAKTKSHFFN